MDARISFPIFLRDRDEWMVLCASQASLEYRIEAIDVEGAEYDAWDSQGKPIHLHVIDDKPVAAPTDLPPEIAVLRRAILRYADIAGKAGGLGPQAEVDDLALLFRLAEEHISKNQPTLLTKFRRWLGRP